MPIPECDHNGLLPPGVLPCTLDELRNRFGVFQGSDRRPKLFGRFVELIGELRRSSLFIALVVNGSFTTTEPGPNDIDIILVLRKVHDSTAQLAMSDYALVDRRSAQRGFGFDLLIAREGSLEYEEYVGFFAQVRGDRQKERHVETQFMSKEQEILAQTIEQLERMNRVLAHLRKDVLPQNPKLFAVMVEGPLDEISRLRTQIEEQSRALATA